MDTVIKSARALYALSSGLLFCGALTLSASLYAATQWQKPLLSGQQHSVATQQKIDQIDDKTQQNLQRYQALRDEIRQLEKQLQDKRHLVERQENQLQEIQQQRLALQEVEASFYPLLNEMTAAYSQLVTAEPQLLPEERHWRNQLLQQNSLSNTLPLAEQTRALLSAYQIEGNYNQMLVSWLGEIKHHETTRAVQFLAVGRVALYYLTLDGELGGVRVANDWRQLSKQERQQVQQGIAMAQHQQPEQVIALPLIQGEVQ